MSSNNSTPEAWDMVRYTLSGLKRDSRGKNIPFEYDANGYEFRLVSAKPLLIHRQIWRYSIFQIRLSPSSLGTAVLFFSMPKLRLPIIMMPAGLSLQAVSLDILKRLTSQRLRMYFTTLSMRFAGRNRKRRSSSLD